MSGGIILHAIYICGYHVYKLKYKFSLYLFKNYCSIALVQWALYAPAYHQTKHQTLTCMDLSDNKDRVIQHSLYLFS